MPLRYIVVPIYNICRKTVSWKVVKNTLYFKCYDIFIQGIATIFHW